MGEEVISLAIHLSATQFSYSNLKPCQESAVKQSKQPNASFQFGMQMSIATSPLKISQ